MNVVVMIPALEPDEKLVTYVEQLVRFGFPKILIINDGSPKSFDGIFERCAAYAPCTVLRHEVNRGKGRALKTGMRYYLENLEGYDGIVMGDADGQHTLEDTAKVAALVSEKKDTLILGSRGFRGSHVPKRSRLGNKITSLIFGFLYGQMVRDTQTGLRGLPNALIPWACEINGERFEYEMNMLVQCRLRKAPILETPIQTIYIEGNRSSHFNPLIDSVRVYRLLLGSFFRYMCSGLFSYAVDITLYTVIVKTGILNGQRYGVLIATAAARVLSSACNYLMNKRLVFKLRGKYCKTFLRYVATVALVLLSSAGLVTMFGSLFTLRASETVAIKLFVDTLLAFASYTLQQKWVFNKQDHVLK